MWNKREEEPIRPSAAAQAAAPQTSATSAAAAERRETAGIGPSITIVGDVTGDEDLTVLGRVEGKIDLPQHSVTVGQSGRVKADIHAKSVSVAGEVRGNLVASEQIVIRKTATMLGNLSAPRVGLEDGCCFRGSVEMETPPPKGRPVPAASPQPGGGTTPASPGPAAPKPEPTARP
jgi:cytoskeletal protein CcmA (bactofilin family)